MNELNLAWLLERDNPGVRLRALTGLCGLDGDHPEVREAKEAVLLWLPAAHDLAWMEGKGLSLMYGLLALAECGLSRQDVPVDALVDRLLAQRYDANCGDMLLLRALVMLGYAADPRVTVRLEQMAQNQLPDGGWMCLHRLNKMKRTPKSCIKAANHGLLLAAELKKHGVDYAGTDSLLDYFRRRRVFYHTDEPERLVLNDQPGYRTVDVFFPNEVMRASLPVLVEALAVLGVDHEPQLAGARSLLESKRDTQGRVKLEGTMIKKFLYLPRESVGKPSKWATLYAALVHKQSKHPN